MKFKQLFCNHEYEFFKAKHTLVSVFGNSLQYNFIFICKHCGKEFDVTEWDLRYALENYEKEIFKNRTKYDKLQVTELCVPCYPYCNQIRMYEGKHVTLLLEKYLKEGIDLKVLEKNCR